MGNRKFNIPMCVALVLLLLTLVTTHLTSGLYARYTAADTNSSSARVAKFQVLAQAPQDSVTVDCAEYRDGSYAFTVTNHSEVAVGYVVTVQFEDPAAAATVQVALDSGPYSALDQNNAITFPVDATLAPLGDNAAHQLHFQVIPQAFFDSAQGDASLELALDFTVTVHTQQID